MKKILIILNVCLCFIPSIVWAEGENATAKQDKKEEKSITNSLAEVTHNILQKNFNIVSSPYVYKDSDPFHLETRYTNLEELSLDTSDPLFKSQSNRTVDVKQLCKEDKDTEATNKGKYDPDCAYISKDFGICDTHAYNAGLFQNPTDATAKENMKTIISAKITVLSQQMYKQYEYLNATLTRLEKQLQKAVLTTELEMASGKSDSESSSYSSSSSKETPLAGAENCMYADGEIKTCECLRQNILLIQSNIETNRAQAKKQLEQTYKVAKQWGIYACEQYKDGKSEGECKDDDKTNSKTYTLCESGDLKTKENIKQCVLSLTSAVSRAKEKAELKRMQYSSPNYRY